MPATLPFKAGGQADDVMVMTQTATPENFDEPGYLAANPDIADAVRQGAFSSGRQHFDLFGHAESRIQTKAANSAFLQAKEHKLQRIALLLRHDMVQTQHAGVFDFLTGELRAQFAIIDTHAVSSNPYEQPAVDLIHKHSDGVVLDCGAGYRPIYYPNVVNFEIAAYPTTDVRGVGEKLPFKNNSFDAVFSLAVLEHVKDPFACAREIIRVLKPGGDLMCCVPLLQPVHGYPHHYYNMTAQGLENLFGEGIQVDRHEVTATTLPIWSLTWIVRSWAEGLTGTAKQEFLNLKMSDLLQSGGEYLNQPFVTELSTAKNFELASCTTLFGHKLA